MKKQRENIINELILAFDLPFSDGYMYEEENVREETFENKLNELITVKEIVEIDSIINFALFETLGKEHPSVKMWLESETDLKASIYLVLGGYYRQAVGLLRNWFEFTLIGIFYDKYFKGKNSRFEQFLKGKRQSPTWKDLLNSLFKRESFLDAEKNFRLKGKLEQLYKELSAFIHSKGIDYYNLQNGRDNVPRFLEHSFNKWFAFLKKIIKMNVLVLKLAYKKQLHKYFTGNKEELIK